MLHSRILVVLSAAVSAAAAVIHGWHRRATRRETHSVLPLCHSLIHVWEWGMLSHVAWPLRNPPSVMDHKLLQQGQSWCLSGFDNSSAHPRVCGVPMLCGTLAAQHVHSGVITRARACIDIRFKTCLGVCGKVKGVCMQPWLDSLFMRPI